MKTISIAIISLGLCLSLSGQDGEIFFRVKEIPRTGVTVLSSDTLSPSLRAAVDAKAELAGIDEKGAVLRASRGVPKDRGRAIQWLKTTRLASAAASSTKEFVSVDSMAEVNAARQKPVELVARVWQKPTSDNIAGLKVTGWIEGSKLVRLTKAGPITAGDLEHLAAQGILAYAEPNHIFSFGEPDAGDSDATPLSAGSGFPNDPYFANHQVWGMEKINAPALWQLPRAQTPTSISVAVIDTGIDRQHEDLAANIEPGYNAIDGSMNVQDDHGHGTHCAGVIGAIGDNHLGVAGIAWKVRIVPIKAFDATGGGTAFQLADAIDFAIRKKVKVINASWGTPEYNDALAEAIKRAVDAGIVVVAAAGNRGFDIDPATSNERIYPASLGYPGVISVMAIDRNEAPPAFSNYGKEAVTIAAPGDEIVSTWLMSQKAYYKERGTSMAAPHVAGLVAALWIVDTERLESKGAVPAAQEVIATIKQMARKSPALVGKCATEGYAYWDPARLIAYGVKPTSTVAEVSPPSLPAGSGAATPPTPPSAEPEIKISGVLEVGAPAIGGETSGIVLRVDDTRYELVPTSSATRQTMRGLNGRQVTVNGKIKLQPGIERPNRPVLETDSIELK